MTSIKDQILYEDNHIIIVNKLPSQIVQGDKTGDIPLSENLKSYLKAKYHKPGNVFLGVVHRLDRPVSGAVIFARTSKALARLNQMLQSKEIQKTYWAVVKTLPQDSEGHLIHYIIKDEKKNKSFILSKPSKNAKNAELLYRHIASSDKYHLFEINLITGRHHQIRAQLSAIGCPIKGDVKYGFARPNKDLSIHLHARKIEFIHPVKNEKMRFIAPPPSEPLWDYFSRKFQSE